ncbi:sure-like protein [Thermothelomyces heterothallicus CBS 203.75]
MHILVVNDDGPPSPHSSPYVHSLVRELQAHGHTVSVCLPHTQRSWIGKAHMIGQTVKPLYYRPPPPSAPAAGLIHEDDEEGESATTTATTITTTTNNNNNNNNNTPEQKQGQQGKLQQPPRHGTTHARPSTRPGTEEWILVDGTPASCVQIGLYHFFRDRGPVDLVVSGPNYGRNTTAVFALSSGTLGGALEAAVCRHRAVALSYAFFTRNHDTSIIEKASRQSVRVIEALVRDWPDDGSVDLYSVNVPLLEGLEEGKVLFTPMLQNYWGPGSCFTEVDGSVDGEDEDEERIREDEGQVEEDNLDGPGGAACHTHKHFKWSPRFADVYKSVDEAPPGNDGWAVKEGHTSVTPLKANFFQAATELHGKELQLGHSRRSTFGVVPKLEEATSGHPAQDHLPVRTQGATQPRVYALIDYDDEYVQPLILSAVKSLLPPESYTLVRPPSSWSKSAPEIRLGDLIPTRDAKVLQIMPYESIDFDYASTHPDTCLVNSYMIRKALIRKHFLSATVDNWVAKHPDSVLKTHVKRSEAFEVDYAEFLDDALVEAFDLRESLERNAAALGCAGSGGDDVAESVAERGDDGTVPTAAAATAGPATPITNTTTAETRGQKDDGVEWWILKPSMSDRGQGIRLFSTMEQLQGIFDEWEPESSDDEDEDDRDHIMTSHLRHFVAQPYIHPPLLLPELGNRKFHIRVYVLCVGSMRVYVYRDMLALFAAKPYRAPGSSGRDPNGPDLVAHLTNTCLQTSAATNNNNNNNNNTTIAPGNHEDGTPPASAAADLVLRFGTLPLDPDRSASIVAQICAVTGDLFEAAARAMPVHFQPAPHAFEVYGLDFLPDAQGRPWLLEVNAFPDFRQTGPGLAGVVARFWKGVVRRAVVPFVVNPAAAAAAAAAYDGGDDDDGMMLVREVDLGKR